MKNNLSQVVIITGASSGIGLLTAKLFAKNGYCVYDFSRKGTASDGIRHIDCDVTNAAQCEQAIKQVVSECGKIDILICNAGMGISGAVEFTTNEEAHRQMEVNFFGIVNIVKPTLPIMRAAHSGRILLVSSLAAAFSIPFQAHYSASKSAVNALALALRNELHDFGIKVSCLMPGDSSTGFTQARHKSDCGSNVYPHMHHAVNAMEHDEAHGTAPQCLANQLFRMARTKRLKACYTVGMGYKMLLLLARFMPMTLANWIVGKKYGVR